MGGGSHVVLLPSMLPATVVLIPTVTVALLVALELLRHVALLVPVAVFPLVSLHRPDRDFRRAGPSAIARRRALADPRRPAGR